jgi:proline utilization trans-activator
MYLWSRADRGLECFLSFDLDAAFSSALVLLIATTIDPSLLGNDNRPADKAYQILEEMKTRGNQVAGFMLAELRQLETILEQVPPLDDRRGSKTDSCQSVQRHHVPSLSSDSLMTPFMDCAIGDADWQYTMTTEQMIQVADSLDFEGFDWAGLQ